METQINKRFYELDNRGVRAFVRYANHTGKWAIECYRKKREDEIKDSGDWKMIRVGHIQSYWSRQEAELKVIELAEEVAIDNGF